MSFRIEEKVILTTSEMFGIRNRLIKEGMSDLYPSRVIRSIYFDSRANGMYVDSEEGVLPRKKLRIRSYDGSDAAPCLETKISSIEGRFKTTKNLTQEMLSHYLQIGIVDSHYGVCTPKVEVSYSRKYYQLAGVRITFDTDIKYRKCNSQTLITDRLLVMEIKASTQASSDFLNQLVDEPRRRFSKFSRACLLTNTL